MVNQIHLACLAMQSLLSYFKGSRHQMVLERVPSSE
jgi:hypothetical protein